MDWHSFFVDDMTLSLCLFIFTYHGHKYTTLQKIKGRRSLLRLRRGGATDFLLICVDFLLLPLTFWHVTMTTPWKLYCILITYSHISLVWLLQSALSMKCVCVCRQRHERIVWPFGDFTSTSEKTTTTSKEPRRRRRRKRFFLFGWRSIIHSHPSTPHVVNVIGRGHVRRPAVDMAILEVRGQRQGQSFVFTGHSESL